MAGLTETRERANRKHILIIIIAAIIMSAMAIFEGLSLRAQCKENLAKQAEMEELIAQEKTRSEELEKYSEYTQTTDFAEWYAKEKMGLIYKNEIIFRGE